MPETLTAAELAARYPRAAKRLRAERDRAGRPDAAAKRIREAVAAAKTWATAPSPPDLPVDVNAPGWWMDHAAEPDWR